MGVVKAVILIAGPQKGTRLVLILFARWLNHRLYTLLTEWSRKELILFAIWFN